MLKTKYEININGINICIEGEYENYEALDNERNSLVNSVIFAFKDISNKIPTTTSTEAEKPLKTAVRRANQPSAPATDSQIRYLGVLGYNGSTDLSYQEANQIIRQYKAGSQN